MAKILELFSLTSGARLIIWEHLTENMLSDVPDKEKARKILKCILESEEWCWVSKIARKTGLAKSTVSYYINNHLSSYLQDVISGDENLQEVLRLRPLKIEPQKLKEVENFLK